LGGALCPWLLKVLEESVKGRTEREDVVVVLESPDILLHAGVGYSGAMDLVMGVMEVLLALSFLSFFDFLSFLSPRLRVVDVWPRFAKLI